MHVLSALYENTFKKVYFVIFYFNSNENKLLKHRVDCKIHRKRQITCATEYLIEIKRKQVVN